MLFKSDDMNSNIKYYLLNCYCPPFPLHSISKNFHFLMILSVKISCPKQMAFGLSANSALEKVIKDLGCESTTVEVLAMVALLCATTSCIPTYQYTTILYLYVLPQFSSLKTTDLESAKKNFGPFSSKSVFSSCRDHRAKYIRNRLQRESLQRAFLTVMKSHLQVK